MQVYGSSALLCSVSCALLCSHHARNPSIHFTKPRSIRRTPPGRRVATRCVPGDAGSFTSRVTRDVMIIPRSTLNRWTFEEYLVRQFAAVSHAYNHTINRYHRAHLAAIFRAPLETIDAITLTSIAPHPPSHPFATTYDLLSFPIQPCDSP